MIDPTVRLAQDSDVGQLTELEAESRAALVDQRGGARWLETHPVRAEGWAAEVAAGSVVVAHIADVVVGYLASSVDGRVLRVDEVYVAPGAREVGFGDALVEAATELGRSAGCTMIEAEALPGDRDTKNLYERAGITARLIVVSRRLV